MEKLEMDSVKLKNAHILLVDDEEYLLRLWKKVMEKQGYFVQCYASGLQALGEFKGKPDFYDIVVSDNTMEDITGKELAEELFKIKKDVKIIICTGYVETINYFADGRIKDILIKPFDSKILLEAIHKNLSLL